MAVQLEAVSPLKLLEQDLESSMADQQFTDSGSSPGSSSDCAVHGPGSASETSMWEEWTQATNSAVGDEVSTSNFFPDLTTSSSTSSRLSFQQSDMLSTWMSSFHPLTPTADPIDHQPTFMHDLDHPDAVDALPLVYESKTTGVSRQLLRALGPLSPSSPLAIHNGLLNPLGDPWDGQWTSARSSFFPDHSAAAVDHLEDITTTKPRHTDIFIGPNGTFESATPGGWTPQILFDRHASEEVQVGPTPLKLMASLREAAEVTSCAGPREIGSLVDLRSEDDPSVAVTNSSGAVTMAGMLADCKRGPQLADVDSTILTTTWPGKHRLELVELVDGEADVPLLKRPKTVTSVEENKFLQSWSDQTYYPASGVGSIASQAMDIIAIGPALNTNGKPRARRGSATDPQSVYARHRREKINERLKNLQNLVPNGAKVDIVTMLDEAIHYVKFLQNQVELLKSDDYWMYATPNNYNGMDLSELQCTHSQELESSA